MEALPRLYSTEEVAQALSISPGTFAQWRQRGQAPRHFKVHGAVRYAPADVLAWLQEQNPGMEIRLDLFTPRSPQEEAPVIEEIAA